MKTYKLLRDMPTVKAGTTFREITREVDGSKILKEYKSSNKVSILVSEVNDFDEWFEKIEPTDSIHWKPKIGDRYWALGNTIVYPQTWGDDEFDRDRYESGKVYKTKEEGEKALDRELAKVRLQRTSNFKPDFENDRGGWVVYYDHGHETLAVCELDDCDAGEPVRYATREEAKKSIEENERDWKIYFGIKEEIK